MAHGSLMLSEGMGLHGLWFERFAVQGRRREALSIRIRFWSLSNDASIGPLNPTPETLNPEA